MLKLAVHFAIALALSACGGSSSNTDEQFGSAIRVTGDFDNAAIAVSPGLPTATTPISIQVSARFTGNISPTASTFPVPFNLTRNGAPYTKGTLQFTLVSGTGISAIWNG